MQNKGGGIPVTTNILTNLDELGINPSCFRFGCLTLEGDKYVGVKETNLDGGSHIIVIDTQTKSVNKKPMKAESALIHPLENILVVRGKCEENGCTLQIFNLETKEKLGAYIIPEPVVYWRWLSSRILAVIGEKGIYHWTIELGNSNTIPIKIFERAGKLSNNSTQIVGYQTDSTQRWCLLMGLCPVTCETTGTISVQGQLQLFSVEKRQQQLIEGFSGNFGELIVDDHYNMPASVVCFVEKKQEQSSAKLHVMDISGPRGVSGENSTGHSHLQPFKATIDLPISETSSGSFDFPIYTYLSNYFGVVFVITRGGVLYLVEPTSSKLLYTGTVCQDSVFLGSPSRFHGICIANKKGLVLHITLNSLNIIPYIQSNFDFSSNGNLIKWARRYGYQGTDEHSISIFNESIKRMDYLSASRIASLNKSNSLRTPATLNHFKMVDSTQKILFQYFMMLLKFHTLNQFESIELVRLLFSTNISAYISEFTTISNPNLFVQSLINEEKLTFSEELGDILLSNVLDKKIALKVYNKCNPINPTKILQTLINIGNYEDVVDFIREQKSSNWPTITTDIRSLLNSLLIANNVESTVEFVKTILIPPNSSASSEISQGGRSNSFDMDEINLNIDKLSIVDIFISHGKYREITSILLDHLKGNRQEDSALQTKLFELNLLYAPQVAEALFQMDIFTHFDKHSIAMLCEKAGLYERSLENFTDMKDIRRILGVACASLNTDWLANYLSKLDTKTRFGCLKELLIVCKNSMSSGNVTGFGGGANSANNGNATSAINNNVNSITLSNSSNNGNTILQSVIQVCIKNIDNIGIENIITLFEQQNIWEGIYYVIGSNLSQYLSGNVTNVSTFGSSESITPLPSSNSTNNTNSDSQKHIPANKVALSLVAGSSKLPNSNSSSNSSSLSSYVIFKYIESSIHLGQIQETERICRDFPQSYDPDQVIEYFKNIKMSDLRPLIWVCDLHHRVEELVNYLYHMSLYKYIQVYTLKINPSQTPLVIGTLIDLDGSEDFVKSLLQEIKTLGSSFSFAELIQQAENRNRLKLLLGWLEERAQEGYQDPSLHNALAKIYIDMNKDSENFLKTNGYYDSKTIGDYCEDRDPYLAYIAYRKAWGQCDDEIIQVTYKNDLYRLLARYLVERQDLNLWNKVLDKTSSLVNEQCRQSIIDQVVSSILPEFYNKPEEISCIIRAFINADVPNSLLELLEKIIFHVNNPEFSKNRNLQNLLLLTSMKIDVRRLDDYISRLDNYDAKEVAKVAMEHNLPLQTFHIYKKFSFNIEAINTLLLMAKVKVLNDEGVSISNFDDSMLSNEQIADIDYSKAHEFAVYCNDNSVWDILGQQYLQAGKSREAIDCFVKSENTRDYRQVIENCLGNESYGDLYKYLQMVRRVKDSRISKDPIIDTELAYCMSKLEMIEELQAFLQGINTVQLQKVGDRLMEEGVYKYSIIFYQAIPNYSRLTSCYIQLEEYNNALESAKKANSPKTWKELLQICMQIGQPELAYQAGINIIVYPDYCEDVVSEYEKKNMSSELLTLLEGAIQNTERAHGSLFTELGILYAKYTPEKLMEYCSKYSGRINIPKLTRICEQRQLWKEVVYLYMQYREYDQAVLVIINHSDIAWNNEEFLKILKDVTNVDIVYKSMTFYLHEHPELLNNLLKCIFNPAKGSLSDNSPSKTGFVSNSTGSGNVSSSRFDISSICTRFIQEYFSGSTLQTVGDSEATADNVYGKKNYDISIIQDFLETIYEENIQIVNESLINLYIDKVQVNKLMKLISTCDNYDQVGLSSRLEKHPVNELRKIAVKLLDKNSNYKHALSICQKEMLIDDAILVAYRSGNVELIEELLEFLLINNKKDHFVACLYTCYEYLRPDMVLELAWKHNCLDMTVPFFVQSMRDLTNRIQALEKKLESVHLSDAPANAASVAISSSSSSIVGHQNVSCSQNVSNGADVVGTTSGNNYVSKSTILGSGTVGSIDLDVAGSANTNQFFF